MSYKYTLRTRSCGISPNRSWGSWRARRRAAPETRANTMYPPYPPRMLCSTENENREVDMAGPIALEIETAVCDRPFVAPNERLLGAEAVTYIKMHPMQPFKKSTQATKTQTNHDMPQCFAKVLIMGKAMKTGANVETDDTKILFTPYRRTRGVKKSIWKSPVPAP